MVGFFITTRGYRWGTMRLFECIKEKKAMIHMILGLLIIGYSIFTMIG
jgi:hypothetical protein